MAVFDSGKFIGGEKMPLYGEEENGLSLQLVDFLVKSAREFCKKKGLPEKIIPELFGSKEGERFARELELKIEVKSCPAPRPEGLDFALNTKYEQSENLIVI